MSDVFDHLRIALADGYAIDEEIGGYGTANGVATGLSVAHSWAHRHADRYNQTQPHAEDW